MKNNRMIQKFCIIFGACLVVLATVVLVAWQVNVNVSAKRSKSCVDTICTLLPDRQNAVPETRRDNTMATLSVNGKNFVGIIEMPKYQSALPVCAEWGSVHKQPCLFSGSIYNGTVKIGGTTQKGQYDFYREISVGDSLFYTDMEGNRFALEVTDIRYEKHADNAVLDSREASLTLFIKNVYAPLEYIIVYCNVPSK